jgi:hypothetical protein
MTFKKKLSIAVLIALVGYYLIGFPLTLLGYVKEWPIFPGGPVIKFEGGNTSNYEDEIVTPDNDGPYIFYQEDSLQVVNFYAVDSVSVPEVTLYSSEHRDQVPLIISFLKNPSWDFSLKLKDSLQIELTSYQGVSKLLAISDIEGEFGAFRELLISNHVVDSNYNWTFGSGHLVLLGDFVDRGTHVTECLWLIYDLEKKAEASGGKVHFILGNHEIMNMTDDFRYVRRKYIFNSSAIGKHYSEFYKPDTELGRWLSTKNIIERIDNIIFTHGGLSDDLVASGATLEKINATARPLYFSPDVARLSKYPLIKILFNSKSSPFWNRDYANQRASQEDVDQSLATYKVNKVVVGHTLVESITALYTGKVIVIDTKHAESNSQALLIENGRFFSVDRTGERVPLE